MLSTPSAAEIYQIIVLKYCSLLAASLIIFEHLVTLSTEVDVIWRRRLTNFTSILFLVNRYNLLLQAVFSICFVASLFPTDSSCKVLQAFNQISYLVSFAVWALFSALRVYTIDNRNVSLSSITLALGLVPLGTNLYYTVKQLSVPAIFGGHKCNTGYVYPDDSSDRIVVISRACLVLCDFIVLCTTLFNTYTSRRLAKTSELKPSLCTLLARDGTLCFTVLLALNCIQIVLWLTNTFQHFYVLVLQISSIVISRFIMTLREIYLSSSRPTFLRAQYTAPSQLSTVHFTSVEAESLTTSAYHVSDPATHIEYECQAMSLQCSLQRGSATGREERHGDTNVAQDAA